MTNDPAALPDAPDAALMRNLSLPLPTADTPVPVDRAEVSTSDAWRPGPWSADQAATTAQPLPPCPADGKTSPGGAVGTGADAPPPLCISPDKLRSVVDAEQLAPLTSEQKGILGVRDIIDPFNLIVSVAQAGITVAANSHSAFGPGLKGFGRLTGYTFLGEATGTFFGVYAIPSLTHQDPRYRRMQHASIPRRVLHAVAHTVIAQSDDGRNMPNYAVLATYPITAEIGNLYVPGGQTDSASTIHRIVFGYATDPIGNIIAEFLPDVARHIHLKSVFFQQIVNQVAFGSNQSPAL